MLAWRDGDWLTVPEGATVAQLCPGPSLFETFALRGGRVEAWEDHLARLALACPRFGLDPRRLTLGAGPAPELWAAPLRKLLDRAGLTDAIVRLVVAPDGAGGAAEWLTVRPLPPTPPSLELRLLRTVRDEPEWLPRPKSGPWRNSAEAGRELAALADPARTEGVQFDAQGHVSEGVRSSLAWREGGTWHFPAVATGCLPGTAAAQFRAALRAAGQPSRDVTAPFPVAAESIVVLRSTLAGGGVLASRAHEADGRPCWQASGAEAAARAALAALATARAQRSVSLL
jgi:branched-subunit amino acid aminotransferase/4-amino-4-deoxychorismate lyase